MAGLQFLIVDGFECTLTQKRHTKEELRSRGINICRLCHSGIHDLINEKELAERFTTKEALLQHPGLLKHIAWVKKQK